MLLICIFVNSLKADIAIKAVKLMACPEKYFLKLIDFNIRKTNLLSIFKACFELN